MEQTSMNGKYYRTSMDDIKSSEGWFGKICLLGLISFIPVFGQMTLYGYAYEWAHKAAWGIKDSLPKKIYSRPNSKMLRWGWFAVVITIVFALIPGIISGIGEAMTSAGTATTAVSAYGHAVANTGNVVLAGFGGLISFIGAILALFAGIFAWVGIMRMTMYDRLGTGLQFGKVWAMIKHDFGGLMRILGMALLWGLIFFIIFVIISTVLIVAIASIALIPILSTASGVVPSESAIIGYVFSAFVILFPVFVLLGYIAMVAMAFIQLLVSRALGYWMRQFDVASWGTKDAPLPFELAAQQQQQQAYYAAPQPAQAQQPVAAAQPQAVPEQQPTQPQAAVSMPTPAAPAAAAEPASAEPVATEPAEPAAAAAEPTAPAAAEPAAAELDVPPAESPEKPE